VNDFKI